VSNMKTQCLSCGSKSKTSLFVNTDYITGEDFKIIKCAKCNLARTEFDLDRANLAAYYPDEYYGEKTSRFLTIIEKMIYYWRKKRVATICRLKGKPGKVLDIGCGRGIMLDIMRRKGWECYGTEFSKTSARHAVEVLKLPIRICSLLEPGDYPQSFFDVISIWHVFEHIQDPCMLLSVIEKIIKPQGVLIIEVPNFASLQAIIGRGKWFHLDAPRHLFHYKQSTITNLLERYNFVVNKIRTKSIEYGPYGFLQTLLNKVNAMPNFLYLLLRNRRAKFKTIQDSKTSFLLAAIWNIAIVFPVGLIASVLELLCICTGRGGVIQIIATQKKTAHS